METRPVIDESATSPTTIAEIVDSLGGVDLSSNSAGNGTGKAGKPVSLDDLGISDFAEVLKGVPEHKRDAAIYRYACSRIALGNSPDEIELFVFTAASKCTPPFPENEARQKIKSAFDTHKKNHPDYKEAGIQDDLTKQEEKSKALRRGKRLLKAIPKNPRIVGMHCYSKTFATIEKEDGGLYIELGQVCKKLNLKSELNKATKRGKFHVVKGGEKAIIAVADALAPTGIPLPEELRNVPAVMPETWAFSEAGGLEIVKSTDAGLERTPVAPEPILITAVMKDILSGEEHITLSFFKRNGWRRLTIKRSDALDSRRLVAAVSGRGAPVGSVNCAMVARYLLEFDSANSNIMPLARVKNQFGWTEGV